MDTDVLNRHPRASVHGGQPGRAPSRPSLRAGLSPHGHTLPAGRGQLHPLAARLRAFARQPARRPPQIDRRPHEQRPQVVLCPSNVAVDPHAVSAHQRRQTPFHAPPMGAIRLLEGIRLLARPGGDQCGVARTGRQASPTPPGTTARAQGTAAAAVVIKAEPDRAVPLHPPPRRGPAGHLARR